MAVKKKGTINDYKDRLSSPIGAVRIDPKTRKPIPTKQKKKSK